ncbi:Na/Pi symporter [Lysobacter sp. LF1]|uniref:Na/Pi symporter n=1 Tax=Lysobacter stagni TaxID=3045172 RepID=A0ABT6XLT5_9GAMM|nr:Na/Pi symporter [Lysobacter sp. LF1]MDI9240710.1 Na/Pi symporter [Lysobacter sp. LF1]
MPAVCHAIVTWPSHSTGYVACSRNVALHHARASSRVATCPPCHGALPPSASAPSEVTRTLTTMSTTVSVLGGVGLFLLGMSVMTSGLKALAGSKLRDTLRRMAATPLSGAFWGAFVTLLVQSSSATTMTTIGLVSAGLLTFAQGLGLVFGANVGTTGTGWLIALIGVRVSLTSAALPMIFVGALLKLLGRERWSAAGGALAGFALVLLGLTTLQQGMGGLAEQLQPADFPTVFGPGVSLWSSLWGVLALVALGLAMTAVMQSSTAAIAVTLSAHYAGAIGLDQACALIIGQNIGTATSSALAAIGASSTAKRLALAYVLFKVIAALIALVVFPLTTPLLVRASTSIDGVTLLAAYHTAYNVVGVALLLPLIDRFTQVVERILPERRSPLTRCLDPAALSTPLAAEEAVRRTVARALETTCSAIASALAAPTEAAGKVSVTAAQASDALRQAWEFMSEASGPPESKTEQERLTRTLHALDEASRVAEIAGEPGGLGAASSEPDDMRGTALCMKAMACAIRIAHHVGALPGDPHDESGHVPDLRADGVAIASAMSELQHNANALRELQRAHRTKVLASVAAGTVSANDATARVETLRRLEVLARHARLCAEYLVEGGV